MFIVPRVFVCAVLLMATATNALAQSSISLKKDGYMGSRPPEALWSCQEVSRMCESLWKQQTKKVESCISRNQRKIGREKTPGEIQELEVINNEIDNLIASRKENE